MRVAIKPDNIVFIAHFFRYKGKKEADRQSKISRIKKPYYGSSMQICGINLETLIN